MKFKNPDTDIIYNSIQEAHNDYCTGKICAICELNSKYTHSNLTCSIFVNQNPIAAAKIMGVTVIYEDGEELTQSTPVKNWPLKIAQKYCKENPGCKNCQIKKELNTACPFATHWLRIDINNKVLSKEDIEFLQNVRKMFVNANYIELFEYSGHPEKKQIQFMYNPSDYNRYLTISSDFFKDLEYNKVYNIDELLK